uniref:Retrovirus-related Pol polyprotein from transposon TNT 1-94-like beta-barrel domain-containing protein n=1 Tax=Lactuca sativa TaxID=4236 RepID=A0A9R1UDV1_LACSA|nr:hypothetical protein LSAT_V11C900468360 [Lactuca sativa]
MVRTTPTRWTDKVKVMLHVLHLAYGLDPKLAPIPANPIPEAGKTMDPTIIYDLEKQRAMRRESEELCVGHIKKSLSDRLYDLYALVKDPRELWSALELKYKAHKEGTNKYLVSKYLEFQMANDKPIMELVLVRSSQNCHPRGKDSSKRMMQKYEDYSLDDLMKLLRIEEETHIRDKRGKVGSSVHHVSTGGFCYKNKFGGQNKRNLGPKKQSCKKPSHQNPSSRLKRAGPCHICREIRHYARECKDRKSGLVAHTVKQVTDMVANVNLGEIFMISSLTRAICARGWFIDTRATVHVCGQRESFHTHRPMPTGMVVVCADGHKFEVQGRGDVHLKFTRDKFDKEGFNMELEKGMIAITKGRRYVGRVNNCSGMYHLSLSDEGSASSSSVESGGYNVENVSCVGMNDVTDGMIANVNEVNFSDIESGVVVESRDVEFFDDKFSRDDEDSIHTTSTSTSREILPPPPIVEEPMRSTRARIEKIFGDDFYSCLVEGT